MPRRKSPSPGPQTNQNTNQNVPPTNQNAPTPAAGKSTPPKGENWYNTVTWAQAVAAIGGILSIISVLSAFTLNVLALRIEDVIESGMALRVIEAASDMDGRRVHIERSSEKKTLRSIIVRDPADGGSYLLIIGPHGCGKTSLVLETLAQLGRGGVIYIHIPGIQNRQGDYLAKQLQSHEPKGMKATLRSIIPSWFGKYFPDLPNVPTDIRFMEEYMLSKEFCITAKEVARKEHRRVIIVFDSVNNLDTEELLLLQKMAKSVVDTCSIHIVFIDSGGSVKDKLLGQSAKSRMLLHQIGDIENKTEAMRILKSANVSAEHSDLQLDYLYYEATGGRLALLHLSHNLMAGGYRPAKIVYRLQVAIMKDWGKCAEKHDIEMDDEVTWAKRFLNWTQPRKVGGGFIMCCIDHDILFESLEGEMAPYSNAAASFLRGKAMLKPLPIANKGREREEMDEGKFGENGDGDDETKSETGDGNEE